MADVADEAAVLEAEMNRDLTRQDSTLPPTCCFPWPWRSATTWWCGFQFDELASEEDKQRSWPFNPTSKAKAELAKNKPESDHPMIRTVRLGAGPVLVTVKLTPGPDLKPVSGPLVFMSRPKRSTAMVKRPAKLGTETRDTRLAGRPHRGDARREGGDPIASTSIPTSGSAQRPHVQGNSPGSRLSRQ